jgi:NAD(P)-dependent dehydrogenase (short-subunit alcohol dehydrogenase family)
MAMDLAQHGFDIVPTARSLDESVVAWSGTLNETAERVRELGQRALPVKMDLANQTDIRAGIDAAMDEFGRIDVLITNGAYVDFAPDGTFLSAFVNTSWDSIERHIETNIVSTMLLHRLVLPIMFKQRSGVVINVTQNWSWITMPDLPMPGEGICGMAIPVTRGVTDRMAPCLKREVAPYGVAVLTFDPGLTLSSAKERWENAELAGFTPGATHSVAVPARAASYIATCRDPSVFNGEFVSALDLVQSFGLLSEADIHPDWEQGPQDVTSIPPIMASSRALAGPGE